MSIGLRVFAVGMVFLFLTSCSGNQLGAQDLNAALEKKIQEVQSSVFVIEGLACGIKSLGTGVLLEEGVLTNAHVVAGVESVNLTDSGGTEISYSTMILAHLAGTCGLISGPIFNKHKGNQRFGLQKIRKINECTNNRSTAK